MNSFKLCVIIPVYNVENYIDNCVQSVISGSLSDVSIVLVDDGSTDNSGKKCDIWAQKHNNITVFHKQNGGLMSAWKYGLLHSESEYIGFVDSDDWIDSNMYKVLLDKAYHDNSDIVCCGLIKEYLNDSKSVKENIILRSGSFDKKQIESDIFPIVFKGNNYETRGFLPNRVTKIYRRSVLMKCLKYCDDNIDIGEDLLTSFTALVFSERVSIINDFYPYHYCIHHTSMIRKFSSEKYRKVFLLRLALLKSNDISNYDFEIQINTDYLKLLCILICNEIIYSGKNKNEILSDLRSLNTYENLISPMRRSEWKCIPIQYRLMLFLLKKRMYNLLIYLIKIKYNKQAH